MDLQSQAKVRALRQNPRVAITIDTEGYPPKVLLIRGAAGVELVDGVPEAYLKASRKLVPAEEFASWEAGVRALYQRMALITIEPDWAKLLDFETTIPKAVSGAGAPAVSSAGCPTLHASLRCSAIARGCCLAQTRGIEPPSSPCISTASPRPCRVTQVNLTPLVSELYPMAGSDQVSHPSRHPLSPQ